MDDAVHLRAADEVVREAQLDLRRFVEPAELLVVKREVETAEIVLKVSEFTGAEDDAGHAVAHEQPVERDL